MTTLRIAFYDNKRQETVPAVYCTDLYSNEIAAEQSGQSNTSFNYTKAFVQEDPFHG